MQILMPGIIAFLAEGLGVAVGILLYYLFNIKDRRMIGMLFGGTSGVMLAVICFDILPEALRSEQSWLVFISVFVGMWGGIYLQKVTHDIECKFFNDTSGLVSAGIVFLMGIAIHNIPEGFALGTFMASSRESVSKFAFIIFLHSIPEAIAVAIPLKAAGISRRVLVSLPIILGGIMGIGAIIGYLISGLTIVFMTIALGLAAGIILYIVCEELLPESRSIWNGRLTSISIIMGLLFGMLLLGN